MTQALYACVHAEEFPAQALLRLRTDLAAQPVAVLDGRPPLETVCSLNRAARVLGADLGMTRRKAKRFPACICCRGRWKRRQPRAQCCTNARRNSLRALNQ